MKKFISVISGLIASAMLVTVVYGGDVSTADRYQTIIVTSSVSVTQEVDASNVSTQTLFTQNYINATSMNMDLHEAADDVPFMPGTKNILVRYAFNNAGTNKTSQAQSITPADMDLPAADGEVFEMAFDHPSRFLKLTVSDGIVGTGACDGMACITWEYYNGSWFPFSGVLDNTNGLQTTGSNKSVTWTMPSNWTRETLHTTGTDEGVDQFTGFWIRANLTASGVSAPPSGAQAHFETGRIFYYVDSISSIDQLNYNLYLGGPTDMRTFHMYFPGQPGIVKSDEAGLEPTSGSSAGEWKFDIKNAFRIDTNESGYLFAKPGSMSLAYSNTSTPGGDNTITLNTIGTDFTGVWTHNEEDGEGYYSNTSQESYSKTFYNAASNYLTARDELVADVLSNTSTEVLTNKIGQAHDKLAITTPAFGDKIDDPT